MTWKKNNMKNFYLDAVKGRKSAEAFHALICIYALLQRRLDEYFKPFDLTPVKFNALMLIKYMGKKKGVSQNELCHHLIVSPSNITRLIDRLIKDEYVVRIASLEDRRVNLIKITKKGENVLDKAWHGYGEMIQESAYVLPRKDVVPMANHLLDWFEALNEKFGKGQENV